MNESHINRPYQEILQVLPGDFPNDGIKYGDKGKLSDRIVIPSVAVTIL